MLISICRCMHAVSRLACRCRGAGGSAGAAEHTCMRQGSFGGTFMGTQGCFFWVTGNDFLELEVTTLAFLHACKTWTVQQLKSNLGKLYV